MRSGRLDRLITIKAKTITTNSLGEEIIVYSAIASDIWAERLELRGAERFAAQQTVADISCKYRIRYRRKIKPDCILIDGDNEYDIHAVLEIGRKQGLELICSTRDTNNG